MIAVEFLSNPKAISQKTDVATILRNIKQQGVAYTDPNKLKAQVVISEPLILNYAIAILASRELVDSLSIMADRGLITKTGIDHFDKGIGKDMDFLYERYKNKVTYEDFDIVVTLFKKLALKSLSEFQQKNRPFLVELLTLIYMIMYIEHSSVFVSIKAGGNGIMPKGVRKFLDAKSTELEKLFFKEYTQVSNSKIFNFYQFQSIFMKMREMTHDGFAEFVENL